MQKIINRKKLNKLLPLESEKSPYMSVNEQNPDDSLPEEHEKPTGNFFIRFIKDKYRYLTVLAVIVVLFACILKFFGIYPFGRNTMSSYDMLAQVGPFIEHLFDVFKGDASLFYSPRIAGGADVFGTLCYCLISPFTWIFLLFGEGNVYYGVGIVLPLKLICVSFSALYYINKKHKDLPGHVAIICSLLYAFCGYMFVANTYINWVDFLIYMPFVAIGLERLIKEGKIRYFAISYALMIYTCFSISCFALILVFMCAMLYPIVVEPERIKELSSKICLSCLLAVTVALPLLVPAFIAYLDSGRGTSLFENVNNALDGMALYKKISYIFSDCLFLFLSLVYFIKNGVKRPIDKFFAIAGALILVPVLVDESCNLLNAGSYMSYSLRFGFLNAFYMFSMALRVLGGLKNEKVPAKKNAVSLSVIGLLSAAAIAVIIYLNIDRLENNTYDFSSLFAHSLGGLETIAIILGVIFAVLIVCALLYKYKCCSYKIMSFILVAVFGTQIAFYAIQLVDGNYYIPTRYDEYNEIIRLIDENEEDAIPYYRMKDTKDSITACVPLVGHNYSFSCFSSVLNKTNFVPSEFFSYRGNGQNSIKSTDGMFFGDMLLGYQYYYHHHQGGELVANNPVIQRPYLEMLDYAVLENFTAFKNNAAFPGAFTVNTEVLDFSSGTYCENLDLLYRFLGGEGNFCLEYPLTESGIYFDENERTCEIKIPFKAEGQWYLETHFPDGYDLEYNVYTRTYNAKTAHKVDGSIELAYHAESAGYYWVTIKDLSGKMTAKDVLDYCSIKCAAVNKVYDPDDADIELYDIVWQNAVDYTIKNGNTFVASVTAENGQTSLFLNYVALDGFDVFVNGNKVDFVKNDLNFMVVPLEMGDNKVEIKYSSPYLKLAVYGLIGALLLGFAIFIIVKKQKVFKAISPVISVMGYVLTVAVLGFFIIYPTALCLSKLVALLFV